MRGYGTIPRPALPPRKADRLGLLRLAAVEAMVDRNPGRRGIRPLRALLADYSGASYTAGPVVELDGYEFHAGRRAFERDRAREAAIRGAGLDLLRFTWRR